jgi:hypothetical protein
MKRKSPGIGPTPTNPLTLGAASAISMPPALQSAGAADQLLLKQQLMMEELLRENRNLQGRVARWLESSDADLQKQVSSHQIELDERRRSSLPSRKQITDSSSSRSREEGQDAGDSEEPAIVTNVASDGPGAVAAGLVSEVLNERSPPSLLLARIRRLELALKLEAMERDDVETKVHVQQRMIAYLLKRLNQ